MNQKSPPLPEDDEPILSVFSGMANARPRDGFALRVMARLDGSTPERGSAWWPLALPTVGVLAAVVLLFVAFQMPEPAWLDSDRSLAAISQGPWADGGAMQVASYELEEVHE